MVPGKPPRKVVAFAMSNASAVSRQGFLLTKLRHVRCIGVKKNSSYRGGRTRLEEFDGSVNVAKAASVARRMLTHDGDRWFC